MAFTDYNRAKPLEVSSTNDSGASIGKAQPVVISGGDDSTTGSGDVVIDWSNISSESDIAVYDQNNNLLPYEIESFNTTSEEAVLWVYNSWIRDDSVQAQVVYGDGPASSEENVSGVWQNDIYDMVQHHEDDPLTATDSTSNNNDATVNGASSVSGLFGNAASFDGVDDNITLDDTSAFDASGSYISFDFWFYADDANSTYSMVTNDAAYEIFYNRGGSGQDINFATFGSNISAGVTLATGEWHHVVIEWNVGSNVKFWINGTLEKDASYTNSPGSTNGLRWGAGDDGPGGYDSHFPGDIDELRIAKSQISSEEVTAIYDASPKAGQVFFSQQAAEDIVSVSDWTEKNVASVTDDNGSNPTGIQKVQPVKVTWGNSSPGTGSGDAEFSDNVTVDSRDNLAVFDSSGELRSYEIESFDTSNNEAWIWVYGSWDRDNSEQIVVAAGAGDGTDYSMGGTGSNPWEQSGVNAVFVQHLEESSTPFTDSTANSLDSENVVGTTSTETVFNGARNFDGADDYINFGNSWPDVFTDLTIVAWVNWQGGASDTNNHRVVSRQYSGGGDDPIWSLRLSGGEEQVQLFDDSGTQVSISDSGSVDVRDGSNYLIIASYDDSSPSTELHVDTSVVASDSSTQLGDVSSFDNTNDGSVAVGGFYKDDVSSASEFWDGDIDAVRFYSQAVTTDFRNAEYDASPKAGQTFFSWNGAEPTSINNFEEVKRIRVNSNSTSPGSAKVQPVVLNGGDSSDKTGTGKIGYNTNRIDTTDTASKLESIAFFDEDEESLKRYEVENPEDLGTQNDVVVWVYDGDWSADDTVQLIFAYGGGTGTDQSMDGQGSNPWSGSGVNAVMVQHLNDLDSDDQTNDTVFDSTSNNNDGTVNGAVSATGEFDGASSFDGVDDEINFGTSPITGSTNRTWVGWARYDQTGSAYYMFNMGEGNGASSANGADWRLRDDGEGDLRLEIQGSGYSSSLNLPTSSPGLVAVTLDGSQLGDHTLRVGTNTEQVSGTNSIDTGSNSASFGHRGDGSGHADILLDAVRIYNDSKSSNWMQAEYDASSNGNLVFFSQDAAESTSGVVTLQGNVTINGSNTSGVEVLVYNNSTGSIEGLTTTDSNSAWSLDVSGSTDEYYVAYYYDDGTTFYASGETTNPS